MDAGAGGGEGDDVDDESGNTAGESEDFISRKMAELPVSVTVFAKRRLIFHLLKSEKLSLSEVLYFSLVTFSHLFLRLRTIHK